MIKMYIYEHTYILIWTKMAVTSGHFDISSQYFWDVKLLEYIGVLIEWIYSQLDMIRRHIEWLEQVVWFVRRFHSFQQGPVGNLFRKQVDILTENRLILM